MARRPIDLTKAQTNFAGSGAKAQTDYALAVALTDWLTPASSPQAQTNYTTQMANPAVLARRLTGINKVTNATWQNNAKTLGAPRLQTGIANAGPKWNTGFAPSAQIIDSYPYQPKTTDAATNYDNNAKGLGVALQNAKRARTG